VSATNYKDLAAHAGHSINVVICPEQECVVAECETCSTVLLKFDQTPDGTSPADLSALVALAEKHRIGESDLAETVLDAACERGASATNQGVSGQLEYLLAENGAEGTRQVIEEIARNRRRR
jgi:hypothetical protein